MSFCEGVEKYYLVNNFYSLGKNGIDILEYFTRNSIF